MNFLTQTYHAIESLGKKPSDVVCIISSAGESCSWKEFTELACFEQPDDEFLARDDLFMVFRDSTWIDTTQNKWDIGSSEVPQNKQAEMTSVLKSGCLCCRGRN